MPIDVAASGTGGVEWGCGGHDNRHRCRPGPGRAAAEAAAGAAGHGHMARARKPERGLPAKRLPPNGDGVTHPLMATKLYVPKLRRGLVARPRLLQRMGNGAEAKLTLVSAPAGFGKTTVLATWLQEASAEGRGVAWLSLDAADNEPVLFWTYVVTAVQAPCRAWARVRSSCSRPPRC